LGATANQSPGLQMERQTGCRMVETPQTKQKLPPVAGSSPKAYFPASFPAESYCFIQTRFVIWSSNLNRTNLMSTQLYPPLAHHDFSTIYSGITACTYLQTEEMDV